MIERIDELRAQAEAEIAAATAPDALEELRVRYLGRKAELPQMLRGVAQLPPDQRGAVARRPNQARQALECDDRAARRAARWRAAAAHAGPTTASTSRCPERLRSRWDACTS